MPVAVREISSQPSGVMSSADRDQLVAMGFAAADADRALAAAGGGGDVAAAVEWLFARGAGEGAAAFEGGGAEGPDGGTDHGDQALGRRLRQETEQARADRALAERLAREGSAAPPPPQGGGAGGEGDDHEARTDAMIVEHGRIDLKEMSVSDVNKAAALKLKDEGELDSHFLFTPSRKSAPARERHACSSLLALLLLSCRQRTLQGQGVPEGGRLLHQGRQERPDQPGVPIQPRRSPDWPK